MNRSILIVICDFLLLSLLAFSSVDINKVAEEGTAHTTHAELQATNSAGASQDLAAAMRLALEDERRNRERLAMDLSRARERTGQQESLLTEREKQIQAAQSRLQSTEQQAATLQQQTASLQQQYAAAQTNIQALTQKMQAEAAISQSRLAALQAETKKQSEQSALLQRQLSEMAHSNQMILSERQRLATQLQVTEAEKKAATQQAAQMQEQVKVEREEKAKLAEGVKALASRSGELATEIRENRPMAANTIFNDFLTNKVALRFSAYHPALIGSNRRKDGQTIVGTDGTNFFAICHVQDTPFTLANPATDWQTFGGAISHAGTEMPLSGISFLLVDPRVVTVRLSTEDVKKLGIKPYPISSAPFKFEDAVLVGASEGYYGECKFQIDPSTPGYVRLDRSFLKGLFGKFNPSRGDIVLSKQGELLGIMANGSYCLMMQDLRVASTFPTGNNLAGQHTAQALARLFGVVISMPAKLQ